MYKILNKNTILNTTTNTNIPIDVNNTDYQDYLKWSENNNQAQKDKTYKEIVFELNTAIINLLDIKAAEKNYTNAVSLTSYINSTNSVWKSEAEKFTKWRDEVYLYAYDIYLKIEKNNITEVNVSDFVKNAPKLVW